MVSELVCFEEERNPTIEKDFPAAQLLVFLHYKNYTAVISQG